MKNRLQNKSIARSFTKAVAVLTVLTTTSASFAQTPPTSAPPTTTAPTDEARQHYERGVKLYGEEDYRAALIEFKRAYEIAPNVAVLFNIGQSYYEILDHANALTTFEKYLAEGGNDIPAPRKAQVTSEVDELKGRVAHITVTTNVPDAEILVDDVLVGKTPLAQPLLVSAGRRKVVAQKQGRQTASRIVEIAGGDKQNVQLDLADASVATAPAPSTNGPQPIVEPANRTPAYIALGVAAAGIGVGSVFGVLALGNKSNLDNACRGDKTCPTSSQSDIDSLSRNATISTIGFAVGIVGIGVAVYAFAAAKPHVIEPDVNKSAGLKVEPMLGLGSAGISGRF